MVYWTFSGIVRRWGAADRTTMPARETLAMGLWGADGVIKEDKALTELIRLAAPTDSPPSDDDIEGVAGLLRFIASRGIEFFNQPKRGGWVGEQKPDCYYFDLLSK